MDKQKIRKPEEMVYELWCSVGIYTLGGHMQAMCNGKVYNQHLIVIYKYYNMSFS
jgi:hypothetical protein